MEEKNKRYLSFLSRIFTPSEGFPSELPPKSKGVYFIVVNHIKFKSGEFIGYVGSSTNLMNRFKTHNKIKEFKKKGIYVNFYWAEIKNGFYDKEIKMIQLINPQYNTNKYTI